VDPYQALKTTDTWQPGKLQVAERDDLPALVANMERRLSALEARYVRLEERVSITSGEVEGVGHVQIEERHEP
jgi:hypothetical protein